MSEEKRVQDKEKSREQLRSTNSHSDDYDQRPGVDAMWKGSLGGEVANQPGETVTALRDFTEEPDERKPDAYLEEDEEEEKRKAG